MSPVEIFGMPRVSREPLGLRALAGARSAQHDQIQAPSSRVPAPLERHPRRPRIRVFFMKPS